MLVAVGRFAPPVVQEVRPFSKPPLSTCNALDDGVTALKPISDRFPNFADLIASEPEAEVDLFGRLRAAESIGRPLGDDGFLARLERLTRRSLKPGKRGPKPSEPESRR